MKRSKLSKLLLFLLIASGHNAALYASSSSSSVSNESLSSSSVAKVTTTGQVVDAKGEPLIGVSILEVGTTNGTITDIDGNFTLSVNEGATLEISYIGYKTQTMTVRPQLGQIVMKEDTEVLDEVVVTALGIKRSQKALSYNVQEVKGDALTAVKDANFMNSLAGKVAGVQISSGATGAGGAARVVMRGMKSLTKDNNALYVIDGVPIFNTGSSGGEGQYGDMGGSDAVADLNPDDIASVSMMTGPSAAALYGSAAANGVVLITTKKGQTEKTNITVSNSTTFSKAYIMPEMQNRYGTSSGLFSWGAATANRYDPSDFFNVGTNIINSIALSTGNSFRLFHLGDEVIGRGKDFFAAQALSKAQADVLAIEVLVPVEDVGLDAAVLVLEGRVVADVGHGRVPFPIPPQFGHIDAVRRNGHVDGNEHISRSKADGPAAVVTGHDGPGQGKGAPQKIFSRLHVPHLNESSDDGAADGRRPAGSFEKGQGFHGNIVVRHEGFHRIRIAGSLDPIGKVGTDDDDRRMNIRHEILTKFLRRFTQKAFAHGQEDQAVDADRFDILCFLADGG